MIKFTDLNSLKFVTRNTTILDNYRSRLYADYIGINQVSAYTKNVPCVIFNAYDTIIIQAEFSSGIAGVGLSRDGDTVEYYGKLTAPTGGVVVTNVINDIWELRIPVNFVGCHSFSISDEYEDDTHNSEQIYASDEYFSSSFDPNLLDIQYKNRTGYENGYYWTNYYQRIKVEDAYLTDTDIDVNRETKESVRKEPLVLDSSTLEWSEYTLKNIPEYLAKKIVKASSQTDIIVRGIPMVYKDHSFGDKRDGRIDLTISYTQSNVTNNY